MSGPGSRIASVVVAAALLFDSTAALAAKTPAAAPLEAPVTSWLTLSMLTPAGAIGLGGTAAQTLSDQSSTDLTPPPPSPALGGNAVAGVPLPVIGIWLAWVAVAVYILTKDHGPGRFRFPGPPISPG